MGSLVLSSNNNATMAHAKRRGRSNAAAPSVTRILGLVLCVTVLYAIVLHFSILEPPPLESENLMPPATTERQGQAIVTDLLDPAAVAESERLTEEFCIRNKEIHLDLVKVEIPAGRVGRVSESFVIYVHNNSDIVSDEIRKNGSWEGGITEEIFLRLRQYAARRDLKISDVHFVDIGANVGWFSLALAATGVDVISFEPMEANLGALRSSLCDPANAHLGGRVRLFGHGLSDRTQECLQIAAEDNRGNGQTRCVDDPSFYAVPDGFVKRGSVSLKRVDDVIIDTRDIGVVKIDAEGFEPIVWGGGSKLLHSGVPYIFAEVNGRNLVKVNPDLENGSAARDAYLKAYFDAGYLLRLGDATQPILNETQSLSLWRSNAEWGSRELFDVVLVHKDVSAARKGE